MEEKKRRFRRWKLSSIDLGQAYSWVDYILENELYLEEGAEDRTVGRGLQTAMIVTYCRPFSRNFERDHTAATLDDSFLDVYSERERAFHSRLLDLRNQIFAHTDSEARDLKISTSELGGQTIAWPRSHNPYPVMEQEELETLKTMLEKLRGAISEKSIELQKELSPGEEF